LYEVIKWEAGIVLAGGLLHATRLSPDAAIRRARAVAMIGDLSLSAPQGLYQVRCSSFSLSSSVLYALNTLKREQYTQSPNLKALSAPQGLLKYVVQALACHRASFTP